MPGMSDFFRGPNPSRRRRGIFSDDMSSTDPGEARALALLNALGPMQEAGLQRSAGPMGSIAKNLIPLFGAIIQGKALERQAKLENLKLLMELSKGMGDPEMRTAKINQLKALTAQEQSLAEERKSKGSYREKQQQLVEKLMGGAAGTEAPGGMKPTISLGESGPSVTYRSDVLSPEALQQRKDIQAAGSTQILGREKELAKFKATELPRTLSSAERQTIESAETLIGLLDNAEEKINSIPKNMSSKDLAANMSNYQFRSAHPELTNLSKRLGGYGFPNDPEISDYASWVGQVQSALGAFNIQGQRGGIRLLEYLKDHFPNYADDPSEVARKAMVLRRDSSVIKRRIAAIKQEIVNAASMADESGGTATQGWLKVQARNKKTGQAQDIWFNPTTGATSATDPLGEEP